MFVNPGVTEFKAQFTRDFPYGTADNQVKDSDITSGLADANFNFNPALVSNQSEYTLIFLYLAAHYLCINLQASSQGIFGQYNWMLNSKSVGSVSTSFNIPERIAQSPQMQMYTSTRYGAKFLSLVWPRMIGVCFNSHRNTLP